MLILFNSIILDTRIKLPMILVQNQIKNMLSGETDKITWED